jgi:hypothetical protein
MVGINTTSQSWKNAIQARRNLCLCSFSPSQTRCGMSTDRAMMASALVSSGGKWALACRFSASNPSELRALQAASSKRRYR